jgi:hypothetical protein
MITSAGSTEMRTGSRLLAVVLAGIVWIYAGMTVASGPVAKQAITPSALDVAVCTVKAVLE